MLRSQILKTTYTLTALVLLIFFSSYTFAQSENVISLKQIRPDKACGPRCLWSLMRITKAGKSDCGIKCIYQLIDKKPFSPTNLKDLKDAAEQFGFSAKGYKLKISDLKKMDGYAILPVGSTVGTANDPLHFILVKRVIQDYVIIVNTKTLVSQALPISDLQEYWNGYALVISAGKGMKTLRKEPDSINPLPKKAKSNKYDEIKDFGHVDSGSRLEHTFTLFNETDSQYKAKIVQKSCSCLTAKLGKNIKGRQTLTMELHVNKPAWQEAHAVVLLEPGVIIKRYAIRAYGKDSFQITPTIGYIEAPNGGVVEYPVRIDYFTGSDDIVKFDRMVSTIPNLKSGSVKSESSTKKGATTFTFEIPLLFDAGEPSAKAKHISGNVNFVLNTGKGQRDIPLAISAKVGTDEFRLTPEKAFLMAFKSSGGGIHKKVKLEFLMESPPTNITAKSDNTLPLEIKTSLLSPNTYMIDITLLPEKLHEISLGMNKGEVTIVPNGVHNQAPIILPISLFIRE